MYYQHGRVQALVKLGFQFKTPGQAMLGHAGAGALLGGGAGYALSDEQPGLGTAAGAALGAGAGLGLKNYLNSKFLKEMTPHRSSAAGFSDMNDYDFQEILAKYGPKDPRTQTAQQNFIRSKERVNSIDQDVHDKLRGIL